MASEIVQYEKKFRESEARRVMLECDIAVRGYEVEAMYQSLLEQEKIHVAKINMFQQIVDHIPMPIFWKTIDGDYLGCNKAYEKETGYSRDFVRGKRSEDLYDTEFTGEDGPEELEGLSGADLFRRTDDIVKVEGTYTYKVSIRSNTGRYKPAIFYKALFYDLENNAEGIITFAHTRCDGSLCP